MKKYVLILFCLNTCISSFSIAQDSEFFKVMNYNLLYYRQTFSSCNAQNNSSVAKDAFMKSIVKFTDPDIITVCEMGSNVVNPDRMLTNALNTHGVTKYKQCGYSNNASSIIVNQLFYNSEKFDLYSQSKIDKDLDGNNLVRVIDFYTLYYKDPNLHLTNDTVFLTFGVSHLKAGNTTSDRADRGKATAAVMQYFDDLNQEGNYFFAGDFNVYTSSEPAYQNLINHTNAATKFYDPVNLPGSWNGNVNYSIVHTQSTRVAANTNNGCFSGGGMDDRFDFILINDNVRSNKSRVEYVKDTYFALGQDGMRFNQTISAPVNTSVPDTIVDALFGMSDHLPVLASFKIEKSIPDNVKENARSVIKVTARNPISDIIAVHISGLLLSEVVNYSLYNAVGQNIDSGTLTHLGDGKYYTNTLPNLNQGMYILMLQSATNSWKQSIKIIKN
jgi:hypothetical protein